MTKDELEQIRQRDAQGFSESRKQWSTNRIVDSPSQMASDRHALLRYVDELRSAAEPNGKYEHCSKTGDGQHRWMSFKPGEQEWCAKCFIPKGAVNR